MSNQPYTLPEIAELFNAGQSTIREWVNQGKLPARKEGRQWVVEREIIDEMIVSKTKPAQVRAYRRKSQQVAAPTEPPEPTGPKRAGLSMVDRLGRK